MAASWLKTVATEDYLREWSDGQEISFNIENILGDFNNDNIVNIIDIIIIVNNVLDNDFNDLYDLNDDQLNNILDIIHLMNIVLN